MKKAFTFPPKSLFIFAVIRSGFVNENSTLDGQGSSLLAQQLTLLFIALTGRERFFCVTG